MTLKYDDIINHKYNGSTRENKLSKEARAAQFAPFAALTGHAAAISETARLTSSIIDLSPDELQLLSQKLTYAISTSPAPKVSITYFKPDERKSGGAYITILGTIKKVETAFNQLTLTDGSKIPLDTILDIQIK